MVISKIGFSLALQLFWSILCIYYDIHILRIESYFLYPLAHNVNITNNSSIARGTAIRTNIGHVLRRSLSSTWCRFVCRAILRNTHWFLLCRHNGDNGSQGPSTANERSGRKINRERCKWRGGEAVSPEWKPITRIFQDKPSIAKERVEKEGGWKRHRTSERSDIVSVKVGWSDTRDKCPAGVTHLEILPPSSCLLCCIVHIYLFFYFFYFFVLTFPSLSNRKIIVVVLG